MWLETFPFGPRRFFGRSGTGLFAFRLDGPQHGIREDRPNRIPQFPWETLLFGHGTAEERAWVFILLLRQSDIDSAVIALEENEEKRGGKRPKG